MEKQEAKKLLKVEKHGIGFPGWMWEMIQEGKKQQAMGCDTAWIRAAVFEKGKREGILNKYSKLATEARECL